ncbi:STAS domain-containing protein [Actinomadura sp. 21ATH]|uniref:STAS domain-containing protein n=1 Tax=Actinomadura sp. 21ATH TaxID=1735444 RepID=UPI0035C259DC
MVPHDEAWPAEDWLAGKLGLGVEPVGAWWLVRLRGDLDVVTAPLLVERVGRLIEPHAATPVALETSQLLFCDSSGLNALVRLWKRAAAASGRLVLVQPTARLVDALAVTGLDRFLQVHGTLPDA